MKYDAFLKDINSQDREPEAKVYSVKELHEWNAGLLNEVLSQVFQPGKDYAPYSVYSAKIEGTKLEIRSCLELELTPQSFSFDSKVKNYKINEVSSSICEDLRIPLDNGGSLLIPVYTTTYDISESKSYQDDGNVISLSFGKNKAQALSLIIEMELAKNFGIIFQNELYTNESKKRIFKAWVA